MCLLDMQSCFMSLEHIVTFMNMHTDLKDRYLLMRHRVDSGKRMSTKLQEIAKRHPTIDATDLAPIRLANLKYSYDPLIPGDAPQLATQVDSLDFRQGRFYAMVGMMGQGKATLLNILGGVILPVPKGDEPPLQPDQGFFMPAHLRVLHVPQKPFFVQGSLMENLLFGTTPDSEDAEHSRVMEICKDRLGCSAQVLKHLELKTRKSFKEGATRAKDHMHYPPWADVLSHQEQCLLSIARALISNPEVLIMHQPTLSLSASRSRRVFQVLREFVNFRGVALDSQTLSRRRPRTLIITSCRAEALEAADTVLMLNRGGGVSRVESPSTLGDNDLA